jgi:hypothetical protein
MRLARVLAVVALAALAVMTVEGQGPQVNAKTSFSKGARPGSGEAPKKPGASGPPSGIGGRGGPPGGRGGPPMPGQRPERPERPGRPERPPGKGGPDARGGPGGRGRGRGGPDAPSPPPPPPKSGPKPPGGGPPTKSSGDKVPGGAFNKNAKNKPPTPQTPPPGSGPGGGRAQPPRDGKSGNQRGERPKNNGKPDNMPKSPEAQEAFDAKKAELSKKRRDYMEKTGQKARAGSSGKGPSKTRKNSDTPQAKEKKSWANKLFGGSGSTAKNTGGGSPWGKMGKKAYEKPPTQKGGDGKLQGGFDRSDPMTSAKAKKDGKPGASGGSSKGAGGFFKNLKQKLGQQAAKFNNARGQREAGV